MAVYLLCADARVSATHTARHYCGSTRDDHLDARMQQHRRGVGAALTRAWAKAGIAFVVARVWRGRMQGTEEALKAQKNLARFCPRCTATPRSTYRLPRPEGRYWLWRAASHGKGLSLRTINRRRVVG